MGKRIDYFDDPDAPAATSLVPSANAVVINDDGAVLLIRRSDNGNWALPGGAMDLGESLPGTAVRETLEETGIDVVITGLVGMFTDPPARHPVHQQRRSPAGVLRGLHRPPRQRNPDDEQ